MKQVIQADDSPIVVLDVDETLILGSTKSGLAFDTIHFRLIDTLVICGVKEVYFLTSFKLNILKTAEERVEARQLLRVDLINYLNRRGITVKAVITNHDIAQSAKKGLAEVKADNWMSEDFRLGHYYHTVIRPQEERVRNNPRIDLREDKEY